MGKYINVINGKHIGVSAKEKCESIMNAGGVQIPEPDEFREGLICVVDNGPFGAAGYAYDKREMEMFKHTNGRPSWWFVLENAEEYIDKEE